MSETSQLAPASQHKCLNCDHDLIGEYCANCGQHSKDMRRPFTRLLSDGFKGMFELDGRVYRTLFYLFTKPGFLSREYVSGRRASYTPPLRLYLVISIGFFLLITAYNTLQSVQSAFLSEDQIAANAAEQAALLEESGVIVDEEFLVISDDGEEIDLSNIRELAEGDEDLSGLLELLDNFHLPIFSDEANENFRNSLNRQVAANYSTILDDPAAFFFGLLEYIPIFMLVMMPVLAMIQKILFFRSKNYYVEHLILTLHNHTFFILAIFLGMLVDVVEGAEIVFISSAFSYVGIAISIWIFVYLYLSLLNFFQKGGVITFFIFFLSSALYSVALSFGIITLIVFAFFLI